MTPVSHNSKCGKCLQLHSELKELVTKYQCNAADPPAQCLGLPTEKCSRTQCVHFHGPTLFSSHAQVKPEIIVQKSQQVLFYQLPVQLGYQPYTQIHKSLDDCTHFGSDEVNKCNFQATFVTDLFQFTTAWRASVLPLSSAESANSYGT